MERRKLWTIVVILVLAVPAGVALSRIGTTSSGSDSAGSFGAPPGKSMPAGTEHGVAVDGGVAVADQTLTAPTIGPDVIRTGTLTLAVGRGRLRTRLDAVAAVAQRFGGFVVSSQAGNVPFRSGEAVVRVPSVRFQPALAAIERLGTVRNESISGQDVTSQVVDLHARLVNAEAQRQVLLRLMTRAITITGSIAVENQLQAVELTIEQLQGDLRELANQTSLATITVSLVETGGSKPAPAGTIGGSFGRSLRAAEAVVAAVVVGLGYVLPLAAIVLVVYGCWRGVRLALTRRPATGGPPAGDSP